MKFCLSSRQTPEYLQQADEIRVQYRDYNQIYDLLDQYPNKTIILNCQSFTDKKFINALREFVTLASERLILALFSFNDLESAKEFQVPYYMAYPIQTLEQLRAYKNAGMCCALIDNQLCHQLHKTKLINLPLRAIPNIAHLDTIPREDGIIGNWFRPEEIDDYAIYIDVIEFGTQPERREQALFRIYKKEKEFYGDLGKIVQDLNALGHNALLPHNAMLRRMNCELACITSKNCSICDNCFKLAAHPDLFNKGE